MIVTVLFHPCDEASIQSLTNLLGYGAGGNEKSGLAGCVHFLNAQDCGVKVLILLFSPRKKVFFGFIPNNQVTFVERIHEEVRKEKSKRDIQANKMNNHQRHIVNTDNSEPSNNSLLLHEQ